MSFRRYDHVEKFGNDEVEGIEIGDVLIFPKLDGTNASVWIGHATGIGYYVCAASRNRELTRSNDNAGFCNWANDHQPITDALVNQSSWTLYGEWLVPHTITAYREDSWRRFWIFDVFCREKNRYLHYDEYAPVLQAHSLDVIEPSARYLSPPTIDQLWGDVASNTYLMENGQVGEGIVIKNYGWRNKYGHQPWAKLVRAEFKEENRRAFGTTEKEGKKSVEGDIAEKYCTKAFVEKTLAKIQLEITERKHVIPRLLQTCFHDLVTEEIWHAVKEHKNPTIDFKKLQQYTVYWVKKHVPEVF